MKTFSSAALLCALLALPAHGESGPIAGENGAPLLPPASSTGPIDFSWRQHEGDFPKDKPGYLILTTEDALRWSKMLPAFVKQKEAMGFYVYLATEKDYGTGKTGNAQAEQVRAWMREFNKRAGLKYALLIGNSSRGSSNLPSPTIPDGEKGGMEEAYADLDGAWVDLYLNTKEVDTRSGWVQCCAGSILKPKALKQGGGRRDEIIMSRIAYVGNEIGNGAYDLDRILEKTIRYERETVAGKNLDWRAQVLSIISNYGGNTWDDPLIKSVEKNGGSMEWHSQLGMSGPYVPENTFDGQRVNHQLLHRTRHAGMVSTMSHGWSRGGADTISLDEVFRNVDDRWPSAVGVAACTAFDLADNCNTGQIWLRKGGIFGNGTGWSGNNGMRRQMHINLLEKRVSVGEAVRNAVVTFGDPSLHVLPPLGTPVRALLLTPIFNAHYEERTLAPGVAFKPLAQTYTLTNQSKETMRLTVECDAAWVTLSTAKLTLAPGETATVEAASNHRAQTLAAGNHVANLRFLRDDGQRDERRFAVKLQPVTPTCAYPFDTVNQNNRFSDYSVARLPDAWHDNSALWLHKVSKGPHWKAFVKVGDKVPGYAPEPMGRVGGALRLDNPKSPFTRGLRGYTQWRGASASLWFKVDALPAAKKTTTLLAAPFALKLDDKGTLSFAQGGGKPAPLGAVKPGEWHFVLLRSDLNDKKARASLDGGAEAFADAPRPPAAALTLGSFTGALDEIRTWSGELSDAEAAQAFANAAQPFVPPAPPAKPVAGKAPVAPAPAPEANDGVLRAPKEVPFLFDLTDAAKTLDLGKPLADAGLTFAGLREAPEWLDFKDGVLALKPGVDFDRIDFGGYGFFLALKAKDGRVCEHPMKVRIPVPVIGIRIVRAADNTVSIVSAGGPKRPLSKGVIRYTTDGSPVTDASPVYEKPFKADEGKLKLTARFFYLNEYPYAPVTMNAEFGLPRDQWKVLSISGKAAATAAFDGLANTAWRCAGRGVLPQHVAWNLGEETAITSLSVHSTIKNEDGRIKGFVLHASDDGKVWRKVKEGEFASSPNAQKITFDAPCKARYLKLEATSLYQGTDMVITEIEAFAQ